MHNQTSTSLLQRLRQPGDSAAWDRLVQLYTPLLYSWLRKEGLQQEDASDVVQDVFVVLLEKLPDLVYDRQKGQFRSWLLRITQNKVRDRRKRKQPMALNEQGPLPQLVADDGTVLITEHEYQKHLVGRALELMQSDFEEKTWKACWECIVHDRPAPEVAVELGMTPGAVHAACFRVKARLREELVGLLE